MEEEDEVKSLLPPKETSRKTHTDLVPIRVGGRRVFQDDHFLMRALARVTANAVVHLELALPISCRGDACPYLDREEREPHRIGHTHWVHFTSYIGEGVTFDLLIDRSPKIIDAPNKLWTWYEIQVPRANVDRCIRFMETLLERNAPYHNLDWFGYPCRLYCCNTRFPLREPMDNVAELQHEPLTVDQLSWNCVELVYAALLHAGVLSLGCDLPPINATTAADIMDILPLLYAKPGTHTLRALTTEDFQVASYTI